MQLLTVAAAFFATCAVAANDVVALADMQARDEFQPDPIIGLANVQPRDEFQPTANSLNCLYMTNDVNWAGEGQNLCNLSGYCSNSLPDGLTKNVSSAGPEQGMTCFLYEQWRELHRYPIASHRPSGLCKPRRHRLQQSRFELEMLEVLRLYGFFL
ncbi:hypothetical protein KC322_g16443 [Hortaea werneckii]|nr:hypothetical protein KC322_g16443 [Hortaea werneckii]